MALLYLSVDFKKEMIKSESRATPAGLAEQVIPYRRTLRRGKSLPAPQKASRL